MFLHFTVDDVDDGIDGCYKMMESLNANVIKPRSIQCNVPGESRCHKISQSLDGSQFTLSAKSPKLLDGERLLENSLLYTELDPSWVGLTWETGQAEFMQIIEAFSQHPSSRSGERLCSNEVAWRFWGPTRIYADMGESSPIEAWALRERYSWSNCYDELIAVWGHWNGLTHGSINCSISISTFAFSYFSSEYDVETKTFSKKTNTALADYNTKQFVEGICNAITHVGGTCVTWEYEFDKSPELQGRLLCECEKCLGPSYTPREIADIR